MIKRTGNATFASSSAECRSSKETLKEDSEYSKYESIYISLQSRPIKSQSCSNGSFIEGLEEYEKSLINTLQDLENRAGNNPVSSDNNSLNNSSYTNRKRGKVADSEEILLKQNIDLQINIWQFSTCHLQY